MTVKSFGWKVINNNSSIALIYFLANSSLRYIKKSYIESLALCYTGRCNSKCQFCLQWQDKYSPNMEITLLEIEEIFSSKSLKNLKTLTISGGEPFLRDDFDEVALLAKHYFPKINIRTETNCLLPKRIYKNVKKCIENDIQITVKVSLNGPKEIHDWSRGINRSFERVMETINLLKSLDSKLLTIISNAFYFPENVKYIPWLVDFSKTHEIPMSLHRLQITPVLKNEEMNYVAKSDILYSKKLAKYLNQAYKGGLLQVHSAFYEEKMINKENIDYICTQRGFDRIYINHLGNVYPCSVRIPELCFGNIRKQSLDEILKSNRVNMIRKKIKKREGICKECTNECHLPDSLVSHPFNVLKIIKWYFRKKITKKPLIEKLMR